MNVGFVFCKVLWFFSGWTALLKQQWYLRVRLRLWGVEPVNYQQPTWHIYSRSWYYCKCDVFGTSASTLFSELVWQISSSCGTSIWKFELPRINFQELKMSASARIFLTQPYSHCKIYVLFCNLWVNKQLRKQKLFTFCAVDTRLVPGKDKITPPFPPKM